METALPQALTIALGCERIDEGTPEERASFGLFTIRSEVASLTEGFDFYLNGLRDGPLVPGVHVAEWFAWNWWRLRWEGRSRAADWPRAHQMASIGEGFVWPNITIFSDGLRTALIALPSARPDAKPFRYIGAAPTFVLSTSFEAAVDAFIPQVLGRLEGLGRSNLARIWDDVLIERSDPETAKRRRLEAMLGKDPSENNDGEIDQLLADEGRFGEEALGELAAGYAQSGRNAIPLMTSALLDQVAQNHGYETHPRDSIRLDGRTRLPSFRETPAWAVGTQAARALREQEALGESTISDDLLATYAAVDPAVLRPERGPEMSFSIEEAGRPARLVLRSPRNDGRRFELARLIGDRLISADGRLRPSTRGHTYRQKAQRSFAAEFLAPFEAVDEYLQGDYSEEAQGAAADHFIVSDMTINAILKNNHRLPKDQFDDVELAA